MASNAYKRELKAFVRMDGSGRTIAGSLIWRRRKPKVGSWFQIQASECCDISFETTTTSTTEA